VSANSWRWCGGFEMGCLAGEPMPILIGLESAIWTPSRCYDRVKN
jgi:hypothetical protein